MWFWLAPVLVVIALLSWWLLRRMARPSEGILRQQLAACLGGVGPGRCEAAIELLDGLARRGDADLIESTWQELEIPLLEAVPDCPPHRKSELMRALERCHAAVSRRDLQRRLIDLRNSLAAGTEEYIAKPGR